MTLSRLTILFILIASFKIASGQTASEYLDTLVNNYVIELKTKNIDTICIYQDYCVGCLYTWKKDEDKCNFTGLFIPTYIFWADKGQTFMTKRDNCFDYSVIKVSNDSIWTFFFTNQDTIRKEEIKIPQYIEIKNGKEEVYSSTIDHSYHQAIKVIVRQDILIDKDIDNYYLTKEVGFRGQKNINYDYNINSYLKHVQLLIDRTIKTTLKKSKLTKKRR
jgi:hypothetical protein